MKAIKSWTSITKGMEVDVLVQQRTGKPFIREIVNELDLYIIEIKKRIQ